LSEANENRDWRIYSYFAHILINHARKLYANDSFGIDIEETVYVLDALTIDLCLRVFPWATFRKNKAAFKLHTLLDLRGNIPTFISITDGKVHDVNILDELIPEVGAFYVMDRGYLDFHRLLTMNQNLVFYIIRFKKNTKYRRVYSSPVDKSTGLICDQIVVLTGNKSEVDYPDKLQRIHYIDSVTNKHFNLATNNFNLPALTIIKLYKSRWQVELFFKWIKQHLKIKTFYGTTENAVKTQIWIAVSTYIFWSRLSKKN
jgi:IS4 transposase